MSSGDALRLLPADARPSRGLALTRHAEALEQITGWVETLQRRGQRRHARRVLIAGVRVACLRLIGEINGGPTCAVFNAQLRLAEHSFERARTALYTR